MGRSCFVVSYFFLYLHEIFYTVTVEDYTDRNMEAPIIILYSDSVSGQGGGVEAKVGNAY